MYKKTLFPRKFLDLSMFLPLLHLCIMLFVLVILDTLDSPRLRYHGNQSG